MMYSAFGSISLLLILLLQGCTGLPAASPGAQAHSLPRDSGNSVLTRRFASLSAGHSALSGFHVLTAGMDGLAARIQIIRSAESSLDLQYFIFRSDKSGSLITDELRRAADRGVRIRVIVDDGDTTEGDEKILQLDGYRDMQVRVFNPFDYRGHNRILRNLDFVLHKSRLDYRMHNKFMIADGAVALIGGRNVGDQYFQIDPASQFADDDVFVVGAALTTLMKCFEEFWNSDVVREGALLKRSAHTHPHRPADGALTTEFGARIDSG